ncbi:AMP-binding protein [Candidatus Micrarchaeota archaeon]|nr:AMP-binding protein [Candidatus Micrarchaeota archaeon]MBU1681320.1 AMP-binding protein [Candidatus Micrarchaeota archaeon]
MDISGLKHLIQLRRDKWKDSEALKQMQYKKLENLVASARQTQYYGNLLKDISQNDFSLDMLPVTEKDAVRGNVDSFIRKGISKQNLIKVKTSGSSGQPATFFLDPETSSYRKALTFFIGIEAGRTPFDVFTWFRSHAIPEPPKLYSNLGLYNCLILYMITDERKNLEYAKKYKSTIFGGYPSEMQCLAHANNELENPIKLKYIFSGAEVLSPATRKFIEDSFSCPVFNAYACWEFGPIAFECPEEHNLHINSRSVYLEVLDQNGKPKKSGTGEIVISGLLNTGMPLLRYRLGDLGSLGGACPCGRGHQVLKSIEGRSDDWIILPSGRVRPAFSMNLGDRDDVIAEAWTHQLVQEKPNLFVFRYVPSRKGLNDTSKSELQTIVQNACLGEKVSLEFEEVDSIPRGRAGKAHRVISKVNPPNRF